MFQPHLALQLEIPYKFDENICLFQYRRQFFCIFIYFDFLELERNGLKLLQYSILKYVDWLIVFFDEWNWASTNHMGSILIYYSSFWCVALFQTKTKIHISKIHDETKTHITLKFKRLTTVWSITVPTAVNTLMLFVSLTPIFVDFVFVFGMLALSEVLISPSSICLNRSL